MTFHVNHLIHLKCQEICVFFCFVFSRYPYLQMTVQGKYVCVRFALLIALLCA